MISSSMRWTNFILLSLFFPSTHLHPADPLFSTHLTFDVDFRPVLGIPASFDGPVEDIVVVDRSDTLFSLINHGEFDFTEVKVDYLGRGVSDLLLADFNRDGLDDLLSANASDNSVTHLSGEGGGFFAESGTITVGENPVAITSGNFDLDDQLDFAVLNKADETVIILLGDGEGNFTHGDTLQTGLQPEDIVSGDFNRDGYFDIATCNYLSDDITVFLGESTGHLSVLGSYPASNGPNGIDIGDIDEDGLPDLAVSNFNSRAIALLIGNGDGSFRREEVTPLGDNISWIQVFDIDDDGHLDLFFDQGSSLAILWGNGGGGFDGPDTLPLPEAYGWQLKAGIVIDFDGDGLKDCVAFHQSVEYFSVFMASGARSFLAATPYPLAANPKELLSGDFDDDGFIDVVVIDPSGHLILLLPGDGSGQLGSPILSTNVGTPSLVVAGNFDADPFLDLAAHTDFGSNDSLWIVHGLGDGTYTAPTRFYGGTSLIHLVSRDLNGDGITDLIAGDTGDNRIRAFLVDSLGVPSQSSSIILNDPITLLVENFDADEYPDLATVAGGVTNDTKVRFYRGDGTGGFNNEGDRSVGGHITSVIAGNFREDANGDYPDLIVETRIGSGQNYTYSGVLWVNTGNFVFYESGMFVQDDEGWEMDSGDFDGDGYLDALLKRGLTFSIFISDGLGTFTEGSFGYGFSADPSDIEIVDLDENGLDNVVIVSDDARRLDVIQNIGTPMAIRDRGTDQGVRILPRAFSLSQNFPNPFNPSTTIEYTVPGSITPATFVSLRIYDIRGRLIRSLVEVRKEPGKHQVLWDGRDDRGQAVSSGTFFCRMEAGEFVSTRKLLVVK